jgi:DNA polymerase sigma
VSSNFGNGYTSTLGSGNAFNEVLSRSRTSSILSVESESPIAKEYKSSKLKIQGRFTLNFFDSLNRDIYALNSSKWPLLEDVKKQELLLENLQSSLSIFLGNCSVDHFNSCVNSSEFEVDMDIIISVSSNYQLPLESINLIASCAQNAGMKEVKVPYKSRLPLLRVVDSFTGFKCDLRLDSSSSLELIKLYKVYSMMDSRFECLLMVVKSWFSSRIVNERNYGLISSSTYIFLVLFLCQTRGVLPILDHANSSVAGWKSRNDETLAELLVAFFKYFASDFPYVHGVLSVRTGSILSKESKGWTKENQHIINSRGNNDRYWFCIEHPIGNTFNY